MEFAQFSRTDGPAAGRLIRSEVSAAQAMNRAELDAIELMLRDLNTRHDEIRHRAAFRGCTRELLSLQQELVKYLMAKREGLSGR